MRTLFDLLDTDDGRAYLAERGLFTDVEEFAARLQPPVSPLLNQAMELPDDAPIVHIGQQVCTDYAPWTLSKFVAGAQLQARGDVVPAVLWHDLYQAEAERFGMRLVLPAGTKQKGIWLAPRKAGAGEPRFIEVGRPAVEAALAELATWVSHSVQTRQKPERKAAQARMAVLQEAVLAGELGTLGQAAGAFAGFLLAERLGTDLPQVYLSALMERDVLTGAMNAFLERLDDVRTVFNEAVADLVARDIDPQVRPLPEEYLPLHFSCPDDGTRLRLARDLGTGHHAVATCRCGTEYRFDLGGSPLGLGELAESSRWSPDVSLPVHHNDQASGWVVGRSTALYGLVLNTVIEKVMGGRPIPGWIPPDLMTGPRPGDSESTLLVEYLLGP
jgi:hypothetical protein